MAHLSSSAPRSFIWRRLPAALLLATLAPAASACEDWLAKTVSVTGAVERQTPGTPWQTLTPEQPVCPGDQVRVGAGSRAALYLRNNSFLQLNENSAVTFPVQKSNQDFWLDVQQGLAHFISRIIHRFEVTTPYVNAVVDGTEFVVGAEPARAKVAVLEGQVTAWNDAQRTRLSAGQQAVATSRTAPLEQITVTPAALVQWAIHYPPVLTLRSLRPLSADEQRQLDALTPALQQHRPDLALQALEAAPPSPALDLARAALLLATGQMDDFDARIVPLTQGPHAGAALALQSVADTARNRIDSALASARQAVAVAPDQASSHLALSYALQAALQLNDARKAARKATRVEPDNRLAWLRLAELHLALGDNAAAKKALSRAGQASATDPAVQTRLQVTRGFVHLFELDIKTARQHFEAALQQDAADPQAHLGLGLSLLRDGDTEAGRRELEYAVSLDPLRSTLRSYLGRAYFEEKRDGLALDQWTLAKQFDPNDPTPYFYTGVHKLFANDPIGAVDELETAQALNDRRAVYRSETLLQSDAASRSATLARAYDEAGYEAGVQRSATDALGSDPSQAEGHRLLADQYAGRIRYEGARASEMLQSQLWQPLSAYPLQPQLSESGIAVVEGSGPQRPGLNEYHSLFTQDGAYGLLNGYGGEDGAWGNDLVGAVLAGPAALSLGQYHFETNGWGDNTDQQQNVYNGLAQWQITPATRIQLEARRFDWTRGDLSPVWTDKASGIDETVTQRDTYRIGLVHDLSASQHLLVSCVEQTLHEDESGFLPGGDYGTRGDDKPRTLELQMVQVLPTRNFVYGVSYTDLDSEVELDTRISFEDDTAFPPSLITLDIADEQDSEQSFAGAYGYWTEKLGTQAHVYLGLGYDEMKLDARSFSTTVTTLAIPLLDFVDVQVGDLEQATDSGKVEKWLPKIGIDYQVGSLFQVGAAAYRTFSRTLAGNQGIEPTQFAGFNQRFDDPNATAGDTLGLRLDSTFSHRFFVGGAYLERDLRVPFIDGQQVSYSDRDERIWNLYAVQFPTDWASLRVGYDRSTREDLVAGIGDVDRIYDVRLYSVPLEVRFFLPQGITLAATHRYYREKFLYGLPADALGQVSEHAWVSGLNLQYDLPRRWGSATLGVENLDNETLHIVNFEGSALSYYPGRLAYARFSLNF